MHHPCGWFEGENAEGGECFVNERGHTTWLQGLCSILSTWEPPHVQPRTTGRVVLKPEHTSEPAAGFSCGDAWALLPASDAGILRQACLRICISNKVPVMQRLPVGLHSENHCTTSYFCPHSHPSCVWAERWI